VGPGPNFAYWLLAKPNSCGGDEQANCDDEEGIVEGHNERVPAHNRFNHGKILRIILAEEATIVWATDDASASV